jgi:hypothetical protein
MSTAFKATFVIKRPSVKPVLVVLIPAKTQQSQSCSMAVDFYVQRLTLQ